MPDIVICFTDGEVLHATAQDVSLDRPLLEAEMGSIDPNSERALFALAAIRQIIVGSVEPAPDPSAVSRWDRAAFHFVDGQVLRAWIGPDSRLGRYGGVWDTVEPDGDELRVLAIPYSSLKGVFRLKQWDQRPARRRLTPEETESARLEQLARVLAERDQHDRGQRPSLQSLRDRVRRGSGSP